jgi:hypothetical protein
MQLLAEYQSRLFHYEQEIAALRGQRDGFLLPTAETQRQKIELEAKLAKCQDELAVAYKIIHEKSDLAMNFKDQQSQESKVAQDAVIK